MTELLSSFDFSDMRVEYLRRDGVVGLRLLPLQRAKETADKDCAMEPLVQVKLLGDPYAGGFSAGRTLRGADSSLRLRYVRLDATNAQGACSVTTTLRDDERGLTYLHTLAHPACAPYLEITTTVINESTETVTLEMLSSFTLGGLTPFDPGEATEAMELYRIRSGWAAEGRLVCESIEQLHMERSWASVSQVGERWGQLGSMPVRGYFPFAAVRDKRTGVLWGAELTHASSWQLEAGRRDNGIALSGGLADREFGHWMKRLAPGEAFAAPTALLSVCDTDVDDLCERLVRRTEDRLSLPAPEEELPVIFNEYCTTWGTPQEDLIARIAESLKGRGITYFVIDAGWYAETPGSWSYNAGSWNVSPFLFTRGLDDTLDKIRACGMKPGIWFEFEVAGKENPLYHKTEWLLQRDGLPLSVGDRRFLDFSNPEVRQYLREKVIDFLRVHRFAYMKVDYNDTIGIGVDGCESPGEGLRRQMEAVQDFFREIRRELPELVLEVCSSGGHRLVPSFMELGAMASFSDAHETESIPIIAANVQRMIPARQSQIWAVLHPQQSEAMLYYRLTAGLLGRLCLSGDVTELSGEQWAVVERCIAFYRKAMPVIRQGHTRRYGPDSTSWSDPKGWQAICRRNGEWLLCVVHTFHQASAEIAIPLPEDFAVEETCCRPGITFRAENGRLAVRGLEDLDGVAILLRKSK